MVGGGASRGFQVSVASCVFYLWAVNLANKAFDFNGSSCSKERFGIPGNPISSSSLQSSPVERPNSSQLEVGVAGGKGH
ncbi:hypothetical protein V6N13_086798 [Hibiscus sabdariffa]|uniref:Uncharacterized protein n=1 Tax=Hibiscus sabdariffa TaxID=183260 RepID=A0ABR2FUA4_9ROSI